ncbi:hypothetical protein HDU80_009674, partial [Chytriomyces hyalinus]
LYEPLVDEGLQDYFSSSNIRKHLVNVRLISDDSRVIPKRQFNRNQVYLDRVAHEERNCKKEEERELDRHIENAIRHHIRGEKNKYSKHNRLPMVMNPKPDAEQSEKYPDYLSAQPVTQWKAAMRNAEKAPALKVTETQLFSQLTKMSAKRLREYGLDPNKVIPQSHQFKSKEKLKRVAPSVIAAKKAEVHDDLSEMEMEAERMSPVLKLFEMARKQYEKRDLNATKLLLHELVRVVGGMPPPISPSQSLDELNITQDIKSLTSVPLDSSEIMLIGYIKQLGGNVDKVIKQIEAKKGLVGSAPTSSKLKTTIGRLSAPSVSTKLRPSTARPSRDAEYPIGSEFSDFGSDCGYEVTAQIMAANEDLVSKAIRKANVLEERDENVRNSEAEKKTAVTETIDIPANESDQSTNAYDADAEEKFEDFTRLEHSTNSKEVEQGSMNESRHASGLNQQNQSHQDFAPLHHQQSGSFTSQSSIGDNIEATQNRSKKDVSASMDYIAAVAALEEPSECVGVEQLLNLSRQVSYVLQQPEPMTIHNGQLIEDDAELKSALEEFFEKSASNPSVYDIREVAKESCESLVAQIAADYFDADEADDFQDAPIVNPVVHIQADEENHIRAVIQSESLQLISKEILTETFMVQEKIQYHALDVNPTEDPIVKSNKADLKATVEVATLPATPLPAPTQEEDLATSFETISSFAEGYLVDERTHSEPNITNETQMPVEDKIGEFDNAGDTNEQFQTIVEGEGLEHDPETDHHPVGEEHSGNETAISTAVGGLTGTNSMLNDSQSVLSDPVNTISENETTIEAANMSHAMDVKTQSVQQHPNKPPPETLKSSKNALSTAIASSQQTLISRETSSKDLVSKKSVAFNDPNATASTEVLKAGAIEDRKIIQSDSNENNPHVHTSSLEQDEVHPKTVLTETTEVPDSAKSQPVGDTRGKEIAAKDTDATSEIGQAVATVSPAAPFDHFHPHSETNLVDQVVEISPLVKESILSVSNEAKTLAQPTDEIATSDKTITAKDITEHVSVPEEAKVLDNAQTTAIALGPEVLHDPKEQSQFELNVKAESAEFIDYEDDFADADVPVDDAPQVEKVHDDKGGHSQDASSHDITEQDANIENDGMAQEDQAGAAALAGHQAVDTETRANLLREEEGVSTQVGDESRSTPTVVDEKQELDATLSETKFEPASNANHVKQAVDQWEFDAPQSQSTDHGQDQGPSDSSMSLSNGYGNDFEEASVEGGSCENITSPSAATNSLKTEGQFPHESAAIEPPQSETLVSSSISGSVNKLSASAESVKRSVTFSQTLEQPETAPLQINTQGNGATAKASPSINLNGSTSSITSEEEYAAPPFLNRKSIISDRKPSMFVSSLIRRASRLSPTSMEGPISFPPAYTETMDDLIDGIRGRPSRQMLDRRPSAKSPLNFTLPVDSDSESEEEEDQEAVMNASAVLGASPLTAHQIAQISNPQDNSMRQSVEVLPNKSASADPGEPSGGTPKLEASNQNLSNVSNHMLSSVGDPAHEQGMKPTISRPADLSSASKPSSRPHSIVTITRVGAASVNNSIAAISPSKDGSSPSLNVISNLPRKSRLQQIAGASNPSMSLNGSITSLSSSAGDSDTDYVSPTFMTRASISPDRKASMLVTSLIRRASHASPTSVSPGLIVSKMSPTHDDTEDLMDSVFRRPSRMFVDRRQSMRSPLATTLPADSDSESEDENDKRDVQAPTEDHIVPQASTSASVKHVEEVTTLLPSAPHDQPPSSTGEIDGSSRANEELLGQESDPPSVNISTLAHPVESNEAHDDDAIQRAGSYHEESPSNAEPLLETRSEPHEEEPHTIVEALDEEQGKMDTTVVERESIAHTLEKAILDAQSSSETVATPRESAARTQSIHAGNLDDADNFETPQQDTLSSEEETASQQSAEVRGPLDINEPGGEVHGVAGDSNEVEKDSLPERTGHSEPLNASILSDEILVQPESSFKSVESNQDLKNQSDQVISRNEDEPTNTDETDRSGTNNEGSNEDAEIEAVKAEPISMTEHQSTDSMNLAALLHSVLDLNAAATDGEGDLPGSFEPYQDTDQTNALENAGQTSSMPNIHESHHSLASVPQETMPILEQVMRAVNTPSAGKAPESLESLNLAQLFQSVLNLNDEGASVTDQSGGAISPDMKSPAKSGSVHSRAASVHSVHSQASEQMPSRYKSVPSLSSRQESKTSSRKASDANPTDLRAPISSTSSKHSSVASLRNALPASNRSSVAQPTPPKEPQRITSGLSKSASKNASAVSLNITNRIKSVRNVGSRLGSQSSLIQQANNTSSDIIDKRSVVNSRNESTATPPLNRSNGRLANQSQRTSIAENKAPSKPQSAQASKSVSKSQTQKNSIAPSRRVSANVSQQSLLMQALATAANLLESSNQIAAPELSNDITRQSNSRPSTASHPEPKLSPVPHAPSGKPVSSRSSNASSLRGSSYRVGKQSATTKGDTSNSETPRTSATQKNDRNSLNNQDSEIPKAARVSVWDDILNFANTN